MIQQRIGDLLEIEEAGKYFYDGPSAALPQTEAASTHALICFCRSEKAV
jgi:hypothetical protein